MCLLIANDVTHIMHQLVREAVSYRGLFTAGWFGVREKHCSRLKIYDRLRASEQAAYAVLTLLTTISFVVFTFQCVLTLLYLL